MNSPKTRNENIVVQEMENEILIYDLKDNKAFCLNETSAIIYQLCDGKNSIADISSSIAKKLKQPITDELIWLALDGFKKDNLLEQNEKFEIDFNGLNRRQIVKKIGLASMIALPIVSSIVAPTAAQGASLLPLLANCAGNDQCESNFCTNGPPRCCVPGTKGTRNVPLACCTVGVDCDTECCVGAVPVTLGDTTCASLGKNGAISCP